MPLLLGQFPASPASKLPSQWSKCRGRGENSPAALKLTRACSIPAVRVQNQRPRPSEALLGNVTCDLWSRKEPLRLEGPDVPPRQLAVSLPMQVCTSAENLLYRETFLVFSERNISSAVVKHTLVGDPNVSANIFPGCRCMCLQTPWAANLQGCFGNTCLGREIAMLSSAARMSRRKCLCVLLYSM